MLSRLLAVVALCSVIACDASTDPRSADHILNATYASSFSRSASSCFPEPLPAPSGTNASLYAQVPTTGAITPVSFRIEQSGNAISLLPTVPSSLPNALPMTGTFDSTARTAIVTRTAVKTEAPRAGNHTFFVTETGTDSAFFTVLNATGPTGSAQVTMSAHGTDTFVFREGSAAGAIFTTCTLTETVTAANQ